MAYFLKQVAPPNNASPLIINISGSRFTIGRFSVAELRNLMKVSRRHAVFRQTRKGLSVKDLGSTYGLYINSVKIDGNLNCDLKPGDLIGLGVADESSTEHGFLGKLCRRTDLEDGLITISDDDDDVPTNSNLNNKGLADQKNIEVDTLGDDYVAISNVTIRLNTIQLIDLEKEPECISLTEDTTTRSERSKSNIIDLVDLTAETENDTGYLHLTTVGHDSESAPSEVERDKRINEKEASFREDVESDKQINKEEANSKDNVQSGEQISDNSLKKVKSDKQTNNKEAYSQDNIQSDQQNNKNSQENVQSDQQINNKIENCPENVAVSHESFPILARHTTNSNNIELIDLDNDPESITVTEDTTRSEMPNLNNIDLVDLTAAIQNDIEYLNLTAVELDSESAPYAVERDKRINEKEANFKENVESDEQNSKKEANSPDKVQGDQKINNNSQKNVEINEKNNKKEANSQDNFQRDEQINDNSQKEVESDEQINKKEANSQDNPESDEQTNGSSQEKAQSDEQFKENSDENSQSDEQINESFQETAQSDEQFNESENCSENVAVSYDSYPILVKPNQNASIHPFENGKNDSVSHKKISTSKHLENVAKKHTHAVFPKKQSFPALKPCRILLKKIDPSDFMCSSKEKSLSHKYVNTEIRARPKEFPLAANELTVTSSSSNSKERGRVLLNKSEILCNDENSLNKSIPPFYSGGLFPNNTSDNEQHFVNNIFSKKGINFLPTIYNSPVIKEAFDCKNFQNSALTKVPEMIIPLCLHVHVVQSEDSEKLKIEVSSSGKTCSKRTDELDNVALPKTMEEGCFCLNDGCLKTTSKDARDYHISPSHSFEEKPHSKPSPKSNNNPDTPHRDVSDGDETRPETIEDIEAFLDTSVTNIVNSVEKVTCPTKKSRKRNIAQSPAQNMSKVKSTRKSSSKSQRNLQKMQQNVNHPDEGSRESSNKSQTVLADQQRNIGSPDGIKSTQNETTDKSTRKLRKSRTNVFEKQQNVTFSAASGNFPEEQQNISSLEAINSKQHRSKVKSSGKSTTKSLTDGFEMGQNVISPKVSRRVCSKESQTDFVEQQQNIPLPEVITPRKRGRPRKVLTEAKPKPAQKRKLCAKEAVIENKRKKRENSTAAERKKKPPKYEDDSEWSSDAKVKRSKLLLRLSKVTRNSDVLNSEDSNKFLKNYTIPKKKRIGCPDEKKPGPKEKDMGINKIEATRRENSKTCLFTFGSEITSSTPITIQWPKTPNRQVLKKPNTYKSPKTSTPAFPKQLSKEPNCNKSNTYEHRKKQAEILNAANANNVGNSSFPQSSITAQCNNTQNPKISSETLQPFGKTIWRPSQNVHNLRDPRLNKFKVYDFDV